MFLDSGKGFGFWEGFWILGRTLNSGKCFWILGRVLDSGTYFEFWEVLWILGGVLLSVDKGSTDLWRFVGIPN